MEHWRIIEKFGQRYSVSNIGRIRNNRTGRVLNGKVDHTGYRCVEFKIHGKRHDQRVSRLVLEAFVGPCDPGMQANHKNGNKLDNRAENLEWVTAKENRNHAQANGLWKHYGSNHYRAKITEKDVPEIRESRKSVKELAAKYGVSGQTIGNIRNRKTWKHVA